MGTAQGLGRPRGCFPERILFAVRRTKEWILEKKNFPIKRINFTRFSPKVQFFPFPIQ
jgi:hypothetical protein